MVRRQRTVLTSRRWHHCTVEHRKPWTCTADMIAKAKAKIRGAHSRLAELQFADADVRPVTTGCAATRREAGAATTIRATLAADDVDWIVT